jgi:hypothetical protein
MSDPRNLICPLSERACADGGCTVNRCLQREHDEDVYQRHQGKKAWIQSGGPNQDMAPRSATSFIEPAIGAPPGRATVTDENRQSVIIWLFLNGIPKYKAEGRPNRELEAAYNNSLYLRKWRKDVNPGWRWLGLNLDF